MELFFYFLGGIVLSIVAAIAAYRLKSTKGAIVLVFVIVAVGIVSLYFTHEIIVFQFLISGTIFGFLVKRFSFTQYFTLSVLVVWISFLIVHYLNYYVNGIDVVVENQKLLQGIIEGSTLNTTEKSILLQQLNDFLPLMRMLLPFSYFLNSALISLFIFSILYMFFVSFKLVQNFNSRFTLFRISEWVVFLFIASWATVLFLNSDHIIWSIALNIGLTLCVVYFIQGLAIVNYYIEKKRWSKVWILLTLFTSILLGIQVIFFIIMMFIGLGIIDFWMDFRKSV